MMQLLQAFGSNPLLNLCFLAWLTAQIIKTGLDWISNHGLNLERLTGSGGMPSSHSALVCALAIGTARIDGYQSPMFALTVALASIVMYDAMGVRRAAGEQAKVLNQMVFDFHTFFDDLTKHPLLDFGDDEQDSENDENRKNDPPVENAAEENAPSSGERKLKEYLGHTPLEVLAGALLGILLAMIYPL